MREWYVRARGDTGNPYPVFAESRPRAALVFQYGPSGAARLAPGGVIEVWTPEEWRRADPPVEYDVTVDGVEVYDATTGGVKAYDRLP